MYRMVVNAITIKNYYAKAWDVLKRFWRTPLFFLLLHSTLLLIYRVALIFSGITPMAILLSRGTLFTSGVLWTQSIGKSVLMLLFGFADQVVLTAENFALLMVVFNACEKKNTSIPAVFSLLAARVRSILMLSVFLFLMEPLLNVLAWVYGLSRSFFASHYSLFGLVSLLLIVMLFSLIVLALLNCFIHGFVLRDQKQPLEAVRDSFYLLKPRRFIQIIVMSVPVWAISYGINHGLRKLGAPPLLVDTVNAYVGNGLGSIYMLILAVMFHEITQIKLETHKKHKRTRKS